METPLIGIVGHDLASSRRIDHALAAEGYRTLLLLDGSDPFYTIRQERPDVIIVRPAPEAPDLDWGLLHLLRRDSSTRHTPLLICGSNATPAEEPAGELEGQARVLFMSAPISRKGLITAVKDLLA